MKRLALAPALAVTITALSLAAPAAPPADQPPLAPETAAAQVSKSRGTDGGGAGNVGKAGDRLGDLLSGWAVPVMFALAGLFMLGALARREIGAAVAIVLIVMLAGFFLLTPELVAQGIEGISEVVF